MGYLDYAGLQYLWSKLKEKFAPKSHSHDDRYYTESEMDGKLNSKVNNNEDGANGLLSKLTTSWTATPTDNTYFIRQDTGGGNSFGRVKFSTIWNYIKGKTDGIYQPKGSYAASSHTHDDRYYTESEMNTKLSAKSENIVLASDTNLNNITTPGFYSCGGGNKITNKPNNTDAIGLIVTHNASGNYYTQILTTSSNANTYRRTCLNGSWSGWTQDKYTDTNTWRGIQNNLTSDSTTDSLSAAQGKALKTLVDGKAPNGHTHSFASITDKPSTYTPSAHNQSWSTITDKPALMESGDYSAETIEALLKRVQGLSPRMGSCCLTKDTHVANTWWNFIYTPHRTGSGGDNPEYGTLLLFPMVGAGSSYIVRAGKDGVVKEIRKIYTSGDKPTKGDFGLGNVDNTADKNKSVASAAKLTTARTVSGGSDITLSFNYDGSGNSTANIGFYSCKHNVDNTNNYPFHRFARLDVNKGAWVDKSITFLISQDYSGGGYGICRLVYRSNADSGSASVDAQWLVRRGFSADTIQVAIKTDKTNGAYCDAFYKSSGTYMGVVIRAIASGGRATSGRTWTLVDSNEVGGTTATDKKTSSECWKTIADAGTALHKQAYSASAPAKDEGYVASAGSANTSSSCAGNSASATKLTSSAGSATQPVYFKDGKPVAGTYTLGDASSKTVRTLGAVGNTGWANKTTDDKYIPTMSFMAYWNGAYSGTSSNLQYCDRGRFGTIVTKSSGDYATVGHTHDDRYYTETEVNSKLSGKLGKTENAVSSTKLLNDTAQTALTGTSSPETGLTVNRVYNNGYPTNYGNVISVHGNGSGQILAGWSGTSGAVERLYYRNKRDWNNANWSDWKAVAFTDDKPATAGTADIANSLSGLYSRSSQGWGVQTGTFIHGEGDSTSGDFAFRRDCPNSGQMSMVIDGRFYQNEGQYRVLDESDKNQFATAEHGITASGSNYVRFGNGTQICWGYKNENNRGGTTSFAVAFNNTSYALALTATTASDNAPFITGRTTTSFSYDRHGTAWDDIQWIAVGTWK